MKQIHVWILYDIRKCTNNNRHRGNNGGFCKLNVLCSRQWRRRILQLFLGLTKWLIISAALCSQDPKVCDLFLEAPVKQRLPLVILTSGQSNQSEWWWGGHVLISISSVEQRTLLLSRLVILLDAYAFVFLCGISIEVQCANDSDHPSLWYGYVFCVLRVCCVFQGKSEWIITE